LFPLELNTLRLPGWRYRYARNAPGWGCGPVAQVKRSVALGNSNLNSHLERDAARVKLIRRTLTT